MPRRNFFFGFVTLALLAAGQSAQATFVSNINVTDTGFTGVTGTTLGGNVTSVSFVNLFTLAGSSPPFSSEFGRGLGASTLTVASPSGYTFGSAGFGFFTTQFLAVTDSGPSSETILLTGNFAVGTDPAYTGFTGGPASFLFTVTRGVDGNYSTSGNLALPPSVPEPASVAMLGLGLVAVGGMAARRRMAK